MPDVNEKAKQQTSPRDVRVISREDIPAITEVEVDGRVEKLGEVRDFRWAANLKDFLPSDDVVSFSWVKLAPGEVLAPHEHSIESMIVVYRGAGYLLGARNDSLKEGDVVAVPPGCEHGFKGAEPDGMWCLSIQFGQGIYTDPSNPRVTFLGEKTNLESLLALNQSKMAEMEQNRFIRMLTDGTLDNPRKRQRYLDALQIWSDKNQDLLYARQGTVSDPKFESMFLQHLNEEVGHHEMHADRAEKTPPSITEDPVIEALASWYILQMFKLDNIEKTAIIHLVIENASDIYHRVARPVLAASVNDEYFAVHAADCDHAEMGIKLLRHLSAEQYGRLHVLVEKAWAMMFAMNNRVCELVDQVD